MFVTFAVVFLLYVIYRFYQYLFSASNIDARDKYVLISGCDTGFGHALALALDADGYHVFVGIFNPANRASLIERLSSRAIVFELDVTRQDHIDAAYELVISKTNKLHALVNNAGIGKGGLIDWTSNEFIRSLMEVNFFGHVAMTKALLPLLTVKRHSRIVNVCSVAGFLSGPATSAYSSSKYALEAFSDCLRREMAPWGLHVSIIEPGMMRTPIIDGLDRALHDLWISTSNDIKERWGEEFFSDQLQKAQSNPFIEYAEDPMLVIDALRHAVMNTKPKLRYRPGWQSQVFFLLSMGPAWLVDVLMARVTSSGVPPIGIGQQRQN
jgi:NAD(P)-dependent dehydrogenase (short-subunit alcohol dehydrogenase family)